MDFFYGVVLGVVVFLVLQVVERKFLHKQVFKRQAKREYARVFYRDNIYFCLGQHKSRLEKAYSDFDDLKRSLAGISIHDLPQAAEKFEDLRSEIRDVHESYDYAKGLAYLCGGGREVDQFFSK